MCEIKMQQKQELYDRCYDCNVLTQIITMTDTVGGRLTAKNEFRVLEPQP